MMGLTITEAARLIARRELSPVELTRELLARIAQFDSGLNSFLLLTEEQALADAAAAEKRQLEGKSLGPLDGIPIAHKDVYETAGVLTTGHSRWLAEYVPETDAGVVKRLRDAGTVMLGKLATHEFAFGGPSFDLPWPPARNPWNREHFSGGSSSGTGVAVAAGFILGGTGSDTGGSIRAPAALCGITGLKPTYGLCGRSGVLELSQTLDHTGPLALTAVDCALLLNAMAGYDPIDPCSVERPSEDFTSSMGMSLRGLKVGVLRAFHEEQRPVSAGTAQGIDNTIRCLLDAGASVETIELPSLFDYQACGYVILLSEAFFVHGERLRTDFYSFGELMRERLCLGALIGAHDYVRAMRWRPVLTAAMAEALSRCDVLLTAAMPAEASRLDVTERWSNLGAPNFNMPANVTGFPAMSICSGLGDGGLPVAVQLIGRPFDDGRLLAVADAVQREMGLDLRPSLVPISGEDFT